MEEYNRETDSPPRDRSRRRHSRSRRRGRHHSRHRHSGRKRHRSPSRSLSSSRSPSRSTRSRSSSRSYRRRRYNSNNNNNSNNSGMERPVSDWVCGVCSNPNSAKREDCFRCGTPFAVAINATPCEELRITGIPNNIVFDDIRHALEAHFTAHGDTCNIVAYHMENKNSINNNNNSDEKLQEAHVLFDTVAEATRAVTYARSTLWLGTCACSMTFAQRRRANRRVPTTSTSSSLAAAAAATTTTNTSSITTMKDHHGSGTMSTVVDGLPDHLQPAVWRPVEKFPSEEAEKEYLDLLSKYWDKISQQQKDYYDEGVRRALAAQRRKQQEQQQQQQQQAKNVATSTGETVVDPVNITSNTTSSFSCNSNNSNNNNNNNNNTRTSAMASTVIADANSSSNTTSGVTTNTAINSSTPASTSTTSSGESPVESIERRLKEKKQAVQSGSSATEHTTSAASLKERLALKRAQLSSAAAKTQSTAETENVSTVGTSPASAPISLKDNSPATLHLFYGFPIPSRFPTKTDYLTNSKSPSFRAGVTFRYLPPAVAERILPPSARPPAV